jgi:hypothetical protein
MIEAVVKITISVDPANPGDYSTEFHSESLLRIQFFDPPSNEDIIAAAASQAEPDLKTWVTDKGLRDYLGLPDWIFKYEIQSIKSIA